MLIVYFHIRQIIRTNKIHFIVPLHLLPFYFLAPVKKLFVDGNQDNVRDIKLTAYNLLLLLRFMVDKESYERSYLVKAIKEWIKILNSPGGDGFLVYTAAGKVKMIHTIIMDIQKILQNSWGMFLSNPSFVRKVEKGEPILC